jgi:PAS domain S-box-containing protein
MKSKSEILRQEAEAILQKRSSRQGDFTENEMVKLVHELEVHQIELQMLLEATGEELSYEIMEKAKRAEELLIANKELLYQNKEKEKRAAELVIANKELFFQNDEKEKRAGELVLANKELAFQNDEKAKRSAELFAANKELAFQNQEKTNRAIELNLANIELQFQNEEKIKRADELTLANKLISNQRDRLEEIAGLVPGVVYQYRLRPDGSSCFPYASEAIRQIYHVTPEEVREDAGKVFANIHPDDHDKVVNSIQVSANELTPWQHEYRTKFDDGTIRTVFGNALPRAGADGSVLWTGFITDITESKQAQQQLQDSEARYSSMIANISDIIAIMDADGFKKYESPNMKKYFGWLPEDTAGKSAFSFIHPDDMEYALKVFYSVLGEDRSVKTLEFRYKCKDGTYKPIELTISNLLNDPLINGLMVSFRDISERKLAGELLRNSEARYSAMISNISDVIGIMDANGLMTYKSANIEKFFGWLPEERIGTSGFATIHPDDIPKVQNVFISLLAKENSVKTIEFRYQCKDGTYKPIELTASNQLNNTAINGVLLNYRDISERKAIKANLEEISEKYRGLSEASFESIFISEKGVCIEQNLAAELMFGYSTEEALTRYGTDWIVPEDREMVMNNMISGHQEPYEAMALRKDGSTFPCVLLGRMMQYKGKNVRVTSLTDITARKNAEEKLKHLSTRLALATLAGGVGIWEYDIVNNTMLWDEQMYALYGIKKGDFGGVYETWRAGLHPDDIERGDLEVQTAIRGEKEFYTEFRVIWPDKTVHSIKATAIVKRDETGKALNMVGTNWDITDQKQAQEALSKARNEADAANKAKSLFLANMSHEIRTPLNAIIGFSQLLNREHLTDRQNEYSVSIHRSGEHLLKLLNDILELSKIEAGYGNINMVNIDLYSLLADIRMMFSQQAQSRQLQLTFEIADNLPQYILVDDNKLRQILINLIGNALKFTSKGRISVRALIDQTDEMKTILVIEVQDSGTGISEHEIGKLFRQFEQASEGIKQSNGTGLGLALSREQAILMGGNITVESKEGEGSVFTIRVEIKEGKQQAGEDLISKRVIGIDNTKDKYRVLVVDDKKENLRVAVDFLHWAGFETNEASGGEEAIAKFESWSPHLVLMDIRMPLMDGYEATRCIKATEKGKLTPFIALTASSFEVDWKNNSGFNFQGYIRKPFRESELLHTIAEVLGIEYLYEELNKTDSSPGLPYNAVSIVADMAKLPKHLVYQMKLAVEIADFQRLNELIGKINIPKLKQHLVLQASNFNLDYFQQILSKKDTKNEN